MLHALVLALLPLLPQGSLDVTVIGDATGFGSISELDTLDHGRNYWIEPQTRSFVRVEQSEQGRRVIAGGITGPWFHSIPHLSFSPDGTRLVYIGRSAEGESIVVDGVVITQLVRGGARLVGLPPVEPFLDGEPQGTSGGRILFSPDSRHIAWVLATRATAGPGYQIVLDFEPVAALDSLGFLTFTPGSELVWSTCSKLAPGHLVVAGEAGPEFAFVDRLVFGAGSHSYAYCGSPVGGGPDQFLRDHEVVIDLGEPPYANREAAPDGVVFAPDLSSFAVLLQPSDSTTAALDLLLDGDFVDGAQPGTPLSFSPDGRLFHQRPDGQVVFAEQPGDQLGQVQQIVFAPSGEERLILTSADGGLLVIDSTGTHHGPFTSVQQLEFSPDGAHSIFITGGAADAQALHLDGQHLLADTGRIFSAVFSADGRVLSVIATDIDDKVWAAAAERAGAVGVQLVGTDYARRYSVAVSPDGTTRAAFERADLADSEVAFELYVNGQPTGERFDQGPAAFAFDEDGVLRFISRRGTEVLLLEYTP